MAQAIREAYADLFQINKNAHQMTKSDVVNKFKTLTQGQYSESVLDKMGMTFTALCAHADFGAPEPQAPATAEPKIDENLPETPEIKRLESHGFSLSGLVYNIQLILPESRDPKVYDALFDSLKRHLS